MLAEAMPETRPEARVKEHSQQDDGQDDTGSHPQGDERHRLATTSAAIHAGLPSPLAALGAASHSRHATGRYAYPSEISLA